MLSADDIDALNQRFERAPPQEILAWAWETFGTQVGATSSFQTHSVALLHMISAHAPGMPIFFLDTGFHFPETLAFRDALATTLGLNMKILTPEMGHEGFAASHGDLHRRDPDLCCYINKVEPLEKAMKGLSAWISGVRADQTGERAAMTPISRQSNGLIKICPILRWSSRDVGMYMVQHGLPDHPLLTQGYVSIGCAPCTRPIFEGQDERAGRWAGQKKKECGLHLDWSGRPTGQ